VATLIITILLQEACLFFNSPQTHRTCYRNRKVRGNRCVARQTGWGSAGGEPDKLGGQHEGSDSRVGRTDAGVAARPDRGGGNIWLPTVGGGCLVSISVGDSGGEPSRVRQFARACGLLAKTVKLDAKTLAVFGEREISGMLVRRRQWEEMLKAEKNRQRMAQASLQGSIQRIIACLQGEKKAEEEQIEKLMKAEEEWQPQRQILESVLGVGTVTSATLADLPESGKLNGKKIATLVGVAPMNQDSGKKRGYRKTNGGRAEVRSVLYMATLVACRYNPLIKKQYESLLKRGKEKKVATTACMRKFLVVLNYMMRDGIPSRYSTP